ncbi:MAG: general stress protein CsbD [FCB group bacterium]|jgi:uncharacterized protein YjbJ (UPF0337 family)
MTTTEPKTVTTFTITRENWLEKKSKLKEKFPHLTDSDLEYKEGKMEEMFDKLNTKIGKTIGKSKEGLHKFIEAL